MGASPDMMVERRCLAQPRRSARPSHDDEARGRSGLGGGARWVAGLDSAPDDGLKFPFPQRPLESSGRMSDFIALGGFDSSLLARILIT